MTSSLRLQLLQRHNELRAGLASAAEDTADPLAAYDDFVRWTLQNYDDHSESGLLELLEETVRRFKDDMCYKSGDLRYVKLWILYANLVEKPTDVYAYMFQEGIGKPYALFFQEYAEALEREGRFAKAETVITLGIRTHARPPKHLQVFYESYTSRRAAGKSLPARAFPFKESACSHPVKTIRARPLQNIVPRPEGSSSHGALAVPASTQDITMTTTQAVSFPEPLQRNPYAHLNAPLPSGKNPEKLQFDLTLLLEPDGTEYSFVEARARHLGLLGKKWPPPPPNSTRTPSAPGLSNDRSIIQEKSVKVGFNDQGSKAPARGPRRQSITVTINTKQALEDVFDMYNEGDEDIRKAEDVAGSRTAEFRKSESNPTARPVFRDENSNTGTNPRTFQPHIDQRRENITPGPLKFMPVTTKTPTTNAFTPGTARKALVAKDITTPVPAFKVFHPEQNTTTPTITTNLRSLAELEEWDVFGGEDITATEAFSEEFTNSAPAPPAPRSFTPFVDENIAPPSCPQNKNAHAPPQSKIPKFQVHRDENAAPVRPPCTGEASNKPSFPPASRAVSMEPAQEDIPENSVHVEPNPRFVQSGRFANFDVMTPITERTFEFTTSTGFADTPGSEHSSVYDKGVVALDAHDAAEQLAAELVEADEEAGVQSPVLVPRAGGSATNTDFSYFDQPRTALFRVSDGFTIEPNHGTLLSSAADVLESASSGSKPPNPCVPSDPAILLKLMAAFPSNLEHRELGDTANYLEKLQRFAEKRARRGSGASSSGRTSDGTDGLVLDLDGNRYEVLEKLGEGGFGAVFMARDVTQAGADEEDEEEDGDEDTRVVAIKVVRPTDRWESFVLRRIIVAAHDDETLRRSIVRPHTLYAYQDESFLVLDLCPQGTLLDVVNRAAEIGVAPPGPGGGIDELLAMFFTVELLRIMEGLHTRRFIHGDLKIDNCLVRLEEDASGGAGAWASEYGGRGWGGKGVTVVDFGRAIDTALFPAGQTFRANWPADARDCVEMREGRAWTYEADYAGLAGIVYCMLFGRYIETAVVETGAARRRPAQAMKRYWQGELWTRVFDVLLNPRLVRADGSLPVTQELGAVRGALEAWLRGNCNKGGKNLKGMLKKIEIAALRRAPRK